MIYLFLGLLLVCCVFRQWFASGFIAAGDLWPPAIEVIRELSLQPIAWNRVFGEGLGGSSIPYLWNYFQYAIPIFFYRKLLHLSWEYVVRFGYLFPFLILSVYCSYTVAKKYLDSSLAWLTAMKTHKPMMASDCQDIFVNMLLLLRFIKQTAKRRR